SGDGPVLVIAGAGSGKTRTLTYRVSYLIERGIDPYRILLVTFTNKAAREMLSRVAALVPSDIGKLWGGTFHHIANRILRVNAARIGLQQNFTILDQQDATDLLNSCFTDLGYKKKSGLMPQGAVLARIFSLARNTRTAVEQLLERRYPYFLEHGGEIQVIYNHYAEKKKKLNLVDFDDLLTYWLQLMEEDQSLREFYAQRFQHILVDEYQDTNKLQADIIDAVAGTQQNLMVVGDDSQSIYAFRGANFANIMDFPRRYPAAKIFKLEYNYRSSPEILQLANQSITRNEKQFHKELKAQRVSGVQPAGLLFDTVIQQACGVTDKIREFIAQGIHPGEIAVLYRAHYHSMELQMQLTRTGIPFEIRSGIRFFEQAHIKDIASYLRLLINPFDEVAWKRILQLLPKIGTVRAQKIWDALSAAGSPLEAFLSGNLEAVVPAGARPYWEKLCSVMRPLVQMGPETSPGILIKTVFEGGYEEYLRIKYHDPAGRAEDIERFMDFAYHYDRLEDFLAELALLTSVTAENVPAEEDRETVKLSTIHQAKGLEWPVVFIISLAEGSFPNPKNIDSQDDEEEERRLFYVAVTRARDYLFLCSPLHSDHHGAVTMMKPSRFVREIPEQCFERQYFPGDSSYF
ncbi:MAG: ATP-dependent helicase, partial [Proteobacteria bacterium]|nr:ATP-dependent helicase [Pseudomonadota bacterium]